MRELRELDRSALWFYARAHFGRRHIGWGDEPPDDETLSIVGPGPGRLLDVGCGSGRHSIALAERGFQAIGVDIFGRPLERAQRRAIAAKVPATFLRASATELGRHVTQPFDVILDVLGPASDLAPRFLSAYGETTAGLLAPRGRFVVRTFLGRDELAPLLGRFVQIEERPAVGGRWLILRTDAE